MKIFKLTLIFLVGSVQRVAGWNHASASEFKSMLKKNNIALVACEFGKSYIMIAI